MWNLSFCFYLFMVKISLEFNSIINIWILQVSYEYLLLRLISKDVNNALWLKINQQIEGKKQIHILCYDLMVFI